MTSKEYYLQIWRNLFAGILDWADGETAAWLQRTRLTSGMDDADAAVYHSTPQYWVVGAIIDAYLGREIPDADWQRLSNELIDLLEDGGEVGFLPADTDWRSYRAGVQRIIDEYRKTGAAGTKRRRVLAAQQE